MQIAKSGLVLNTLERRTLDGRTYVVAPVVALVAGVVNGQLAPLNEVAAFVEAWNGRPVPVHHPQVDGSPVSANSPDVIGASVVGTFFNAVMDGDRLKGELWIDEEKARSLGGEALTVLERLEQGLPVEVSTAYFCDVEPGQGVFNGKAFNGIQRNLRPDHIAVLPNAVGACSWADGCGAPRTNAAGDTGVMVAFFLRSEEAAVLAAAVAEWPAGSEVLPPSELHVTLAFLGPVEEVSQIVGEGELLNLLAVTARYEALVYGEVGGIGRFAGDGAAGELDPIYLAVDAPALGEFRERLANDLGWEVPISRRHGFTPHITLGYAPPGTAVPLLPLPRQTVTFAALALAWGGRVTVFPLQGEPRAVDAAEPVTNCNCERETMKTSKQEETQAGVDVATKGTNGVTANEEAATTAAETETTTEAAATVEIAVGLQEFDELVRQMGGVAVLKDALLHLTQNAQHGKETLVSKLAANAACAFTGEELAALPLATLEKLDRSLRPADYSGRGGMRANVNDDEGWVEYKV